MYIMHSLAGSARHWERSIERKKKFWDSSYIGSDIILLIVDDNPRWLNKKTIDVKVTSQKRCIIIKILGGGCFHLFFYLLLNPLENILRKWRSLRKKILKVQLLAGTKVPCLGITGCISVGSSQIHILIGVKAGYAVLIVRGLKNR